MPSKLKDKPIKRRRSNRLANIKRSDDNIIVFKVFTEHVDKNLTKKDLLEQFSSYGKIKEFSLIKRHNFQKNTCKVTYYNPIPAANLLLDGCISFDNTSAPIMVNPSHSWEQPLQLTRYYDANSLITATTSSSMRAQHQPIDILALNDYCLEIIFNYLNIRSQLSLSFCHERLENVFVNMVCSRSISPNLNIDELVRKKYSNWELWHFFKTAGQYIKHIELYTDITTKISTRMNLSNIYEMIEEFCSNIQRVTSFNRVCSPMGFFDYININLLTEIELHKCNIKDQDLEKFVHCSNLISLGLGNNPSLLGNDLPRFKSIQRLSVYNCHAMKGDNLMEACKNMNLKYLDMRCKFGSVDILKYCLELETLKVTLQLGKGFEGIMCLQNLKSLEFGDSSLFTPLSLHMFDEKFCENLEILKLDSRSSSIIPARAIYYFRSLRTLWLSHNGYKKSPIIGAIAALKELEELFIDDAMDLENSDLSYIVENCQKLKRLAVSDCSNFKEYWITSIYKILEERDFNTPTTSTAVASKTPLILYLCATRLSPDDIDEFFYNKPSLNKNLLKLVKFNTSPFIGLLSNDLPFTVPYEASADNYGHYFYYDEEYSDSNDIIYYHNYDSDDNDDGDDNYDSDDSETNRDNQCVAF